MKANKDGATTVGFSEGLNLDDRIEPRVDYVFAPNEPYFAVVGKEWAETIKEIKENEKILEGNAIDFAEWVDKNYNNYGFHGKYSWSKKFPYQNTMVQVTTEELYKKYLEIKVKKP